MANKQKLFQALFIFLIVAVLLFMIWMFFWIKGLSAKCVQDPLEFYAEKTDQVCDMETNHYELSCIPNQIKDLSNFHVDFNAQN